VLEPLVLDFVKSKLRKVKGVQAGRVMFYLANMLKRDR